MALETYIFLDVLKLSCSFYTIYLTGRTILLNNASNYKGVVLVVIVECICWPWQIIFVENLNLRCIETILSNHAYIAADWIYLLALAIYICWPCQFIFTEMYWNSLGDGAMHKVWMYLLALAIYICWPCQFIFTEMYWNSLGDRVMHKVWMYLLALAIYIYRDVLEQSWWSSHA